MIDDRCFLSSTVLHFRLRLIVCSPAEKRRKIETKLINATDTGPAAPRLAAEVDNCGRTVRLYSASRWMISCKKITEIDRSSAITACDSERRQCTQ